MTGLLLPYVAIFGLFGPLLLCSVLTVGPGFLIFALCFSGSDLGLVTMFSSGLDGMADRAAASGVLVFSTVTSGSLICQNHQLAPEAPSRREPSSPPSPFDKTLVRNYPVDPRQHSAKNQKCRQPGVLVPTDLEATLAKVRPSAESIFRIPRGLCAVIAGNFLTRSHKCMSSYFCFALTLAQRARCAAAILRRDDADIVRLGAALPLTFAQRAL